MNFTEFESRAFCSARMPNIRRKGKTWRGPCPLCRSTRYDFEVSPGWGRWRCYKCDQRGDLLDLEQRIGGGGFVEARDRVFYLVGRPIPSQSPAEKAAAARQYRQDTQDTPAAQHWRASMLRAVDADLTIQKAGLFDYLDERAFEDIGEMIGTFTRMSDHLRELYGAALLGAYRTARGANPKGAARMVERGAEDERQARKITELVVGMLERVDRERAA